MARKYKNCVTFEENKRLYNIWKNMKQRCYNSKCERYKDYGGRGIEICKEWRDNFDNFADWAKDNGYVLGLTVERKDVNGNYCPENCCFVTRAEQARNKRDTIIVEYKGEAKPLIEWCEELGLHYDTTHNRIKNGWDAKDAFEEKSCLETSFAKLCREHGINEWTARDRIEKLGWTVDEALNTPTKGRGSSFSTYKRNKKKICDVCGKEFIRNNGKQKYCGERCRIISKRKSFRETGEITNYHGISKNPDSMSG